jgi:hypothetical protein
MTRIAQGIALLAFCLAAFTGCSSGYEPGTTGAAEQEIQSVCLKQAGDQAARYPWEAFYPLFSQRVFCQHVVSEISPSTWPAGAGACTGNPNGQQIPGAGQVDVWLRDGASPPAYYCTRITLPAAPAHFHLAWEPMLEWGWLASWSNTDPHHRRWIQGVVTGPGTAFVTGVGSTDPVNPNGCPVPYDPYHCYSAEVPSNGIATWWQVDTYLGFPEGFDAHRI